jgi:hypothetical protein
VSEAALGTLSPQGAAGGQGAVFRTDLTLDTSAGVVPALYKRYHRRDATSTPDTSALRRQIEFLTDLSADQGRWLTARAAWPMILVDTSGFLMPEAPSRFRVNLADAHGMQVHLAKVQLLLNSDTYLRRHSLQISDRWRMELLADVAETLGWFHAHDIAVADFSCNNLLFSLSGAPRGYLIDCDSVALRTASAVPLADTPEWECPHEAPGSAAVDIYKFGLLAARLFAGSQTTRSVPDGRLPQAIARLAKASLGTVPSSRPPMSEWHAALRAAAPSASDVPTAAAARHPAPVRPLTPVSLPTPSRVPSPAPAPTPVRRRRHPWRWVVVAAGAVLLGIWIAQNMTSERTVANFSQPLPVVTAETASAEPVKSPTPHGPYPTMNNAPLRIRSGPTTADSIVGEIASDSQIEVVCRVTGEAINGPYGTTTNWDRIEQPAAGFVSDAWVDTSGDNDIPAC